MVYLNLNTMDHLPKELTTMKTIRFQDCDPFNHLNNSKYLDYFINTREDQIMEAYGLNIFDHIKDQKKAWVVVEHEIAYLFPAFTMENVMISSKLIGYTSKSIKVEMTMHDEKQSHVKALMWTSFVYIDLKTQKPTDHHEDLIHLFQQVHFNLSETMFKERSTFFKKQKLN